MVAGYIEERDGLTIATVRGAGHAVPQLKPAEAYKLVFNLIKDTLDQI
jgi:serine carboxypeptidase-like clade 2